MNRMFARSAMFIISILAVLTGYSSYSAKGDGNHSTKSESIRPLSESELTKERGGYFSTCGSGNSNCASAGICEVYQGTPAWPYPSAVSRNVQSKTYSSCRVSPNPVASCDNNTSVTCLYQYYSDEGCKTGFVGTSAYTTMGCVDAVAITPVPMTTVN